MVARLFGVGVAWLAAVGLFAALLEWSARPGSRVPPPRSSASTLVRALNRAPRTSTGSAAWVVTRATSVHHVMVVDLAAEHPESARQIAADVVAPVQDRYDELLIYVRALDRARDPRVRRIQWTRMGGYVERQYDDAP